VQPLEPGQSPPLYTPSNLGWLNFPLGAWNAAKPGLWPITGPREVQETLQTHLSWEEAAVRSDGYWRPMPRSHSAWALNAPLVGAFPRLDLRARTGA